MKGLDAGNMFNLGERIGGKKSRNAAARQEYANQEDNEEEEDFERMVVTREDEDEVEKLDGSPPRHTEEREQYNTRRGFHFVGDNEQEPPGLSMEDLMPAREGKEEKKKKKKEEEKQEEKQEFYDH